MFRKRQIPNEKNSSFCFPKTRNKSPLHLHGFTINCINSMCWKDMNLPQKRLDNVKCFTIPHFSLKREKRGNNFSLSPTNQKRVWLLIHKVVVVEPKMCYLLFAHEVTKRIFHFHELYEKVMLGIKIFCMHWAFKIEREPFLDSGHPCSFGKIHEEHQV